MTQQEVDFQTLLQKLRDGTPEAAQEFLDRYGDYLLRVIRRKLEKRLRSRFDSDDFRQDVYASFFREIPPPEAFASSKAFFGYLTAMARNKIFEVMRQRLGPRRNQGEAERSLDGSARIEGLKKVGPDPTASKVFMAEEKLETLTRGKPAKYRKIVDLARLGFTHVEIAEKLSLHIKVVHRALTGLQKKVAT